MAALTPTSVVADGSAASVYRQGSPVLVNLTLSSASDTYTHPVGVAAWAFKGSATDLHLVSFNSTTKIFSIVSDSGTGETVQLLIWQAK